MHHRRARARLVRRRRHPPAGRLRHGRAVAQRRSPPLITHRPRRRLVSLEDRLAPATFNINDGDIAGFVAAIIASNANNETDTINLAAGGHYSFASVIDPADGGSALPSVVSNNSDATDIITING